MQAGMESCVGKTVMAGVMGGGLGAMFGLFMASMRYDTPMGQPMPPPPAAPSAATAAAAAANAPKPPIPAVGAISATATSTVNATATAIPTATTTSAAAAAPTPSVTAPTASIPISDLPMRQQIKHGLRDMYRSSISSGKNFAKVGAIFSGTECAIEGLRAKNDLYNGVAGGCITGGILARNAGPQAVAVGCAGFAVFSAAIDAYMVSFPLAVWQSEAMRCTEEWLLTFKQQRMPEDERSRPIA
jgi:import inner membrane translocase subunit TIM22